MISRVSQPYSLDILKGYLYWDAWSYSGIQRMDKTNGQNARSVINWVYRPTALRAMWSEKQSQGNSKNAKKVSV